MSKTLLLADDSVVIQKLVGLSFASEDVEIVSTDNGDDAVAKAREIRPDLVLADVVMPGKSGYEVCEAIKQDPALAHVPVLLLTGTFEAFDEARASNVGADGHITKPFEAQALVERVKNVMKNAARPTAPATRTVASPIEGLFDEDEPLVIETAASNTGFLGQTDSLDITPSISEDDLSAALDEDLFGPADDEIGETSLGAVGDGALELESDASLDAEEPLAIEPDDQTIAVPPARSTPAPTAVPAAARMASTGRIAAAGDDLAEDLGFDEPLELSSLPPATALDLDSAFDPEPTPATTIQVERDDANAATSRSLAGGSSVTDLDELLATSAPDLPSAPARPIAPARTAASSAPLAVEAPTIVDLGSARDRSDAFEGFGFDVSEQIPVAKVDLLEESFSSLLDVSESQILGDLSQTSPPPLPPAADAAATTTTELPVDEFDVSSGDLLAREEAFGVAREEAFGEPARETAPVSSARLRPPPLPPHATTARSAVGYYSTDASSDDEGLDGPTAKGWPSGDDVEAPIAASSAARTAVDDLSPVLQQRVHETLEKVAWEAFSDLSETIVKQVIERIERIAWEVIPQMAETLVREEIRKMKGEPD